MPCNFCLTGAKNTTGFWPCIRQASNDNQNFRALVINMPRDEIFRQPHVRPRLAIAYCGLGVPRRKLVSFLNDQIWDYSGIVFDASGLQIELLLLSADDVFDTDKDPSERWTSDFYALAFKEPKQSAQHRVLPRIKLLWLALAISCPELAASVIQSIEISQ